MTPIRKCGSKRTCEFNLIAIQNTTNVLYMVKNIYLKR